ncbi:hypothetical protein AAY473_017391 [Plecturocebus cupreus]
MTWCGEAVGGPTLRIDRWIFPLYRQLDPPSVLTDRVSLCCPGWSAGMIWAHCNLHLSGSRHPLASASRRRGFSHVGQAGLELLTSSNLPSSASQSIEITGVSHRTQPY